jgi:hypothetical protein
MSLLRDGRVGFDLCMWIYKWTGFAPGREGQDSVSLAGGLLNLFYLYTTYISK